VIADLLEDDLSTASFDGKTWSNPHHHGGHAAGHFIKWHTIKNQPDSVMQDVRRIREHPWFPQTCLSMAMSTTSESEGSTK
jgi:carbonic anhydrase